MNIKGVILTEKSKYLQEKERVYTFSVSAKLNKHQIKKELCDIFPGIKIKKIRTCRYKPVMQKERFARKLPGFHCTKLEKKAFVELEKQSEDFFAKEEEKNEEQL